MGDKDKTKEQLINDKKPKKEEIRKWEKVKLVKHLKTGGLR